MRRLLIFLAIVALATVAFPTTVGAHRATRFTDDSTFIYCDGIANEHGTIQLALDSSSSYPTSGWLGYTAPGEDDTTWISGESDISLSADGSAFTGSLRLYEYEPESDYGVGDFVGTAQVSLALQDAGEPRVVDYRSRGSNHRQRVQGTVQELVASGSVTLPGRRAFEVSGCQGSRQDLEVFSTAPDSYVSSTRGVSLSCIWETDDHAVYLGGWQESGFADIGMSIADAAGDASGWTNDVTLTASAVDATFELLGYSESMALMATDPGSEEVVGSASVSATMSRSGERFRFVDRFGFARYVFRGERLDVSGELVISRDGEPDLVLAMDEESCGAESFRSQYREATPNGNPRRGRPLANDAPSDAIALAIGDAVSVPSTSSTDPAPEASCVIGEDADVPLGHTAWWSFVGNGDEVTIDTSGSDFDTVVGVYVRDGDELVQVGCVDDVEDLQAVLSIETDDGVTYLVQVGGYGDGSGRLQLAIR